MADMEEESFANAVTDKLESVTVKDSIPSKKVDSDVFPDAVNSNKSALQENIERDHTTQETKTPMRCRVD